MRCGGDADPARSTRSVPRWRWRRCGSREQLNVVWQGSRSTRTGAVAGAWACARSCYLVAPPTLPAPSPLMSSGSSTHLPRPKLMNTPVGFMAAMAAAPTICARRHAQRTALQPRPVSRQRRAQNGALLPRALCDTPLRPARGGAGRPALCAALRRHHRRAPHGHPSRASAARKRVARLYACGGLCLILSALCTPGRLPLRPSSAARASAGHTHAHAPAPLS